jgi:hypothetical protein
VWVYMCGCICVGVYVWVYIMSEYGLCVGVYNIIHEYTHTHTHTHLHVPMFTDMSRYHTYTYRYVPVSHLHVPMYADMSRYPPIYTGIYRLIQQDAGGRYIPIYRYLPIYTGSFNKTLEGDIEMPSLDSDKALAVELKVSATYRIPVSPTYIGHRYLSHIE